MTSASLQQDSETEPVLVQHDGDDCLQAMEGQMEW